MVVTSPLGDEPGERAEQAAPADQVTAEIAPDTLLAAWTEVFPLSQGLAGRVAQHTGPEAGAELVEAVAADYVEELSGRMPNGCRVTADGDLFGPSDFVGTGHDVLFMAVFTTDLDAIVRQHSSSDPTRSG